MYSKVFLVCALAFCLAQAHKDFSGEEHDKTNPLFAFQKSFVKYPYYQDYKHDEIYGKQGHEYPYYNQHFYQHPFLNQYLNKYYNHQSPYVHPVNYVHGQEYNHVLNYPYQHWQGQNVEDRFNNFYPIHQGYQHWQGQDVENKFDNYYPFHQGYKHWKGQDIENKYNHFGSFYPFHHDYQQFQGYNYPHKFGGYYCQGLECQTHQYQGYQQGYVHPLLHKMFGYGYHHYPLYEV